MEIRPNGVPRISSSAMTILRTIVTDIALTNFALEGGSLPVGYVSYHVRVWLERFLRDCWTYFRLANVFDGPGGSKICCRSILLMDVKDLE